MRMVRNVVMMLSLMVLAACGAPGGASVDDWAELVVAGDLSSAAELMQASELGIWSWKEDTSHWNEAWGGMTAYQIVAGPSPAGESQSYTIKWIWKNEKEQCLRVQETSAGAISVLGSYKRCPDASQ